MVISSITESESDAYIAVGGNLGDPKTNIAAALKLLDQPPIIKVIDFSPLYRNAAVGGPAGQPDFFNGAVRVRTTLGPELLLDACLAVERALGRERGEPWGPRTIDLDLLLYGDLVLDSPNCTVPHPRLRERAFVLAPLLDIAPADMPLPPDGLPLGQAASDALEACGTTLEDFVKKRI